MIVQAELSLYPLRETALGDVIAEFIAALRGFELEMQPGAMSTTVVGESEAVFAAIAAAFARVGQAHQAALVIKVSNACPLRDDRAGCRREPAA